jgi:cytochrome c2
MRKTVLGFLLGLIVTSSAFAGPLGDAAKKGDLAEIERLLATGADANEDGAMASPLHWAAMKGHAGVVKLLAENGAQLNALSSMLGAPLHAASRFGRVDAISALLEVGADPDVRDRDEFTPLMRAVVENRPAAVEALLAGGADVNAIGNAPGGLQIGRGPTIALQLSIRFERGEITGMLRSAGAGPIPPEVPSDLAALGDASQGRDLAYANCSACHRIEEADPKTTGDILQGPPLFGLIGRPVANIPGYEYSEDLITYGGAWTPERFYPFALSPTLTVPGTRMVVAEDRTAEMIADITAYFVSVAE